MLSDPIPSQVVLQGWVRKCPRATNSGQVFSSTSFCANSTLFMQIPGLLKASDVPLCRLNREGIMEQI